MTINVQALAAKARKHWAEWLPEMTRELKASGEWERATKQAAIKAHEMIVELMQQGYQAHEAEEVVLSQYILLKPEAPDPDDELERELAEMEEEYQSWAGPMFNQEP